MPSLPKERVLAGFDKQGLVVLNSREELEDWLKSFEYVNTNLVLMSSGNYDEIDMLTFANLITQK